MVRDSKPNKTGFSETICVNCGAPFPERDTLVCEYCNESIPEKVNDWLLEEIK
jgi:predicted amidophosphoribosyltransferase